MNENGKATLVGIVSFGFSCANTYPGVYTKIASFYHWILSKMKHDSNNKINESEDFSNEEIKDTNENGERGKYICWAE